MSVALVTSRSITVVGVFVRNSVDCLASDREILCAHVEQVSRWH